MIKSNNYFRESLFFGMHIYSKQFFQTVGIFNESCKIEKVNISEIIISEHIIVLVVNTPKWQNVENKNIKGPK